MNNLKLNEYPNLLDKIKFSSKEMEKQIVGYPLVKFPKNNKDTVAKEDEKKPPLFLPVFYEYVIPHQSIPLQEQFWNLYREANDSYFNQKHITKDIERKLLERVQGRVYTSLVRELDCALLIKESNRYKDTLFNTQLDLEGTDVLITDLDGKFYGINIYVDTSRSNEARENKKQRGKSFDNVCKVDLPLKLGQGRDCGRFFLYSRKELDQLDHEVARISKLNSYSVAK